MWSDGHCRDRRPAIVLANSRGGIPVSEAGAARPVEHLILSPDTGSTGASRCSASTAKLLAPVGPGPERSGPVAAAHDAGHRGQPAPAKTDYIDLYQIRDHDALTPIEGTLSALDDGLRQWKSATSAVPTLPPGRSARRRASPHCRAGPRSAASTADKAVCCYTASTPSGDRYSRPPMPAPLARFVGVDV